MLRIIEAHQGYNRAYRKGEAVESPLGIVVHDTGANNPNACRYVESPFYLGRNRYKNHWNNGFIAKCGHGIIGKDVNGRVVFVETLPASYCAWLVGGGKKGSWNYPYRHCKRDGQFAHLQFEICEDAKSDVTYYEECMDVAAQVCALWCKAYGIAVSDIVDHRSAHVAGYANNHGDIWDWVYRYRLARGDARAEALARKSTYMDDFRAKVQAYVDSGVEVERYYGSRPMTVYRGMSKWTAANRRTNVIYLQTCLTALGYDISADGEGAFGDATDAAVKDFQGKWSLTASGKCDEDTWDAIMTALNGYAPGDTVPEYAITVYTGTVCTNSKTGLTLWASGYRRGRVLKMPEGATVSVTGACVKGTMAPATYGTYSGFVDTTYVTDRAAV